MNKPFDLYANSLFSGYMDVTGVPTLGDPDGGDPALAGRTLGIINGSSWITLWVNYFGKPILPGVKFVNAGNEAVQLSFMKAHEEGKPCPPKRNIEIFTRTAQELVELAGADLILISCSTMNRSFPEVSRAVHPIPVVQIDMPMMEKAIEKDGGILIIATHGPTVENTRILLKECAAIKGREPVFYEATVEEAFNMLGQGDIAGHNEVIANTIRKSCVSKDIGVVVLAQLSMSVFSLSYPDSTAAFGIPVLNSAETGFTRVREMFLSMAPKERLR